MKKTLFTLVLCLLTTITFSQKLFSLTIGLRDDSSQEFVWGETQRIETPISVEFDGKDIRIHTEKAQYYQTLMPEYETSGGSYWLAYDIDMKKCKFYMVESDGTDFIMIEYDDACIIYGIKY
jgi:hypothetical protein